MINIDTLIGKVVHYYDKIGVAVIAVSGKILTVGSRIKISGHDQEFDQKVASLQINHQQVNEVKAGQEAGLKVDQQVQEGDSIFRIPDNDSDIS